MLEAKTSNGEGELIAIKDLSPILEGRSIEDIIVLDTEQTRVDSSVLSSIIMHRYDGTVNYNQLTLIK